MTEGARDPTEGGGDIQACLVTQDGRIHPSPIAGFPIRTEAKCLQLGLIAAGPFIAWAGGEATGIRISLLEMHKGE